MAADSYNLDQERIRFLERFFFTEAKRKQRNNEKQVAKDWFGRAIVESARRCRTVDRVS